MLDRRSKNLFGRQRFKYHRHSKFSSKEYTNPFFAKKKSRAKQFKVDIVPAYIKAILIAIVIIALAAAWFLLYSSFFKIKNIEINNNGKMAREEIESIINEQMNSNKLIFLPQSNIFLFSKLGLLDRLEKKYSFDSVQIDKKLPNKLAVSLKEKQYAIIWHEDDKYYFGDIGGVIITETNVLDIKDKNYPIIDNLSNQKIADNKAPINQITVEFIIKLLQKLGEHKDEIKALSFIIDDDLFTVKVNLENGPKLYFSTQGDIDKQLEKVLLIKKDQLKNDFFKKEYINVKIEDRVYYR